MRPGIGFRRRAGAMALAASLTGGLLAMMSAIGIDWPPNSRGAALTVELLPLVSPPPPPPPIAHSERAPPISVIISPPPIVRVDRDPPFTASSTAPPPPPPLLPEIMPQPANGLAPPGGSKERAVEPATIPPDAYAFSLQNPVPVYPEGARRRREQGTVVLSVWVDAEGHVVDLRVRDSSGHHELDEAALAAVRHWRFAPATKAGTPVAARGFVELPFVLRRR